MTTVASTATTPAHYQPHPTIESHSSATPQPAASSRATGPPAPQWSERDVPPWLQKHMIFWKVEPTPIRARTWMLEGFDHFQINRLSLPSHLEGIKKELEQEWEKQSKVAPKKPATRAKRKADTDVNAPASKRTKGPTPIKSEGTPQIEMPPPPPPKPLGNLKGKYAILTDLACCEGQSDPAHDYMCNIVLSPGDGETMRGHFNMGEHMDYNILMFFEKRPTEASSQKVWFRWRGTKSYGGFKKYRGDDNHGWVKFLGDCRIEVWFDKLRVHLDAQKGRGMGEKSKHSMVGFWGNWHDYDEKGIDLLDTSKLFPDW
ncbi:hypothetical protein NXS19_006498 [Fusarium pseudograminearum]|nr:hypothetical protein NXS19_006498 [Fusarium pseudograminearum]